ncbi:MAG: ATP-dependent helicase RecQ, partial [Baekduia sp.]|nr:ATP-dependent helicase RecQ [Baekduia sp.]
EDAILAVVRVARPSIGRTRVGEVLRGGQAKALIRNSWDGLPEYGTYAHLTAKAVLDRIDALLDSGQLETTGGPRPVLRVASGAGGPDGGAAQPSLSFEAA